MNQRQKTALQRLSRLDSLASAERAPQPAKLRAADSQGAPATIEAAIGAYIMKDNELYELRRFLADREDKKETYVRTAPDAGGQETGEHSGQMAEYLTAAEESRLANARSGRTYDEREAERNYAKLMKALADDPSARYQLGRYRIQPGKDAESVYDVLDANRCSGFLLYSYDKNGAHSVLGEHITPGSYGGRITGEKFISKA